MLSLSTGEEAAAGIEESLVKMRIQGCKAADDPLQEKWVSCYIVYLAVICKSSEVCPHHVPVRQLTV